jgi:outer membrane autotransporter protein
LYPRKESGLFAKAGGGYVSNWSNRPGEPSRKSGWGLTLGGGYDFLLNENIALSPFANISYGETGNWDYRAITFGLGVTFP